MSDPASEAGSPIVRLHAVMGIEVLIGGSEPASRGLVVVRACELSLRVNRASRDDRDDGSR